MTDRFQRFDFRRTLQRLTRDTASFGRAADALEDVAGELLREQLSSDVYKSIAKFQGWAISLVTSLLAIIRNAERAMALVELSEGAAPENDTTPDTSHGPASLAQMRERAVNAFAAVLIQASGGDVTHEDDLLPVLHGAEKVIDVIADYVLALERREFS